MDGSNIATTMDRPRRDGRAPAPGTRPADGLARGDVEVRRSALESALGTALDRRWSVVRQARLAARRNLTPETLTAMVEAESAFEEYYGRLLDVLEAPVEAVRR